jgi:hypothetical protein
MIPQHARIVVIDAAVPLARPFLNFLTDGRSDQENKK